MLHISWLGKKIIEITWILQKKCLVWKFILHDLEKNMMCDLDHTNLLRSLNRKVCIEIHFSLLLWSKHINKIPYITSSIFSTSVDILLTFATLKMYVFLFLSSISLTTSESFPLPLHEMANSFSGMYFTLLTQSEWTWPRVWYVTKREWFDRSYRKNNHHLL